MFAFFFSFIIKMNYVFVFICFNFICQMLLKKFIFQIFFQIFCYLKMFMYIVYFFVVGYINFRFVDFIYFEDFGSFIVVWGNRDIVFWSFNLFQRMYKYLELQKNGRCIFLVSLLLGVFLGFIIVFFIGRSLVQFLG